MTAPAAPASLTAGQVGRRYLLLTGLRWLPVGISIPVTVLLGLSRGLSLADLGVVFLVHSLLVAVLELPTGGLADVLGRRPVLIASGVLHLLSSLAYATAEGLAGFLGAACLLAAGRALDSGPLEAWYVDAVHLTDPGADVTHGLSRAGAADCLSLAAGALVGGALPGLLGGAGADALRVPYLLAAALDVVSIGAVLLLVTPTGPVRERSAPADRLRRALRDGVQAVPRTVRDAVALSLRDASLRRVLLLSLVCGYSLGALELLGPVLFSDLAGSVTGGSAVFGVVMAASFVGGAAGYALAPRGRLLFRGSTRWAVTVLSLLSGLALLGVASARTVVLAATAYTCFYLANAAAWPLLRAVGHGRVAARHRATVVSGWSLALQAGGALSSLVSPRLGGTGRAYVLAGGLAGLAGLLALGLPRDPPPGAPDEGSQDRAPQELTG